MSFFDEFLYWHPIDFDGVPLFRGSFRGLSMETFCLSVIDLLKSAFVGPQIDLTFPISLVTTCFCSE